MLTVLYVGHATVLLELDGVRLVTDPLLRRRVAHLRRLVPLAGDLRPVDAVLLSHLHRDHADLPSLRRLGQSTPLIAPRGAGLLLRRRGFHAVHELDEGESTVVRAVRIEAVAAEHDGRRHGFGAPAASAGYVIRGSRSVYFAGDTDVFPAMAELAGADLALLPIAGWGPRLGAGHLDPIRAAEAARLLRPRVVVPIHWGTYVPSYRYRPYPGDVTEEFTEAVAELAPDVEVRVLRPGEQTAL